MDDTLINADDRVLVTGAAGFIGFRVVERLLARGFKNVRCLTRPSSGSGKLNALKEQWRPSAQVEITKGNLLSRADCRSAAEGASVIYHLAAGTGTDSFPDAFMNSVVTTRNLLDAALDGNCLKRFVNVSSFAVYTNRDKPNGVLDESCPIERDPVLRGEAYAYAKIKQEELVVQYGKEKRVPFVIVRPGVVYGPGKRGLTGRVGLGTFGVFMHLGSSNRIPLTYVENCAEAIVLAGLKKGVDGETFNVLDDDIPTSRQLLRQYKANVEDFKSVFLPRPVSYLFFCAWEKYSGWSHGQLPPVFNRRSWHANYRGSRYSNDKLKRVLGWSQLVSTSDGLKRFFEFCRKAERHA